jgi:hypothetical protein
LTVDIERNTEYETGDKRRKGQSGDEATKSARTSLATSSAGPRGQSSEDSDTTLDSGSDSDSISESGIHEPGHIDDRSKSVAKHIAGHLQMLMLLTLRFATLMNETGIDDDGVNSNSVEVDGGDSTAGGSVEMGSVSDMDVERSKEESASEAHGAEEDIRNDDTTIPDCDVEVIIPTRYDYLNAEDDEFLQGVIGSGAYQSWHDDHNEVNTIPIYVNGEKILDPDDPMDTTEIRQPGLDKQHSGTGTLVELLRDCAVAHREYSTQHFWGYATLKKVVTRERVLQELLAEQGVTSALKRQRG